MILKSFKDGWEIHLPTSGGKAGKGRARTSTYQVRRNNIIQAQYRFDIADRQSRDRALMKAVQHVHLHTFTL